MGMLSREELCDSLFLDLPVTNVSSLIPPFYQWPSLNFTSSKANQLRTELSNFATGFFFVRR